VNGQLIADGALLDTVTVPAATASVAPPPAPADVTAASQVAPGRVRIKLFFPESLAGDIPFHCHLVDHEDNGMMGVPVSVILLDLLMPHRIHAQGPGIRSGGVVLR
jgi:FtsP/CotA-like multicopper oxidase with cupredoxin domain